MRGNSLYQKEAVVQARVFKGHKGPGRFCRDSCVLEHTLLCLNKGSRMQPPVGTTTSVFILRDRPSRDLKRPRATTCFSLQSTKMLQSKKQVHALHPFLLPGSRSLQEFSFLPPYAYVDKAWALKERSCWACYVPLTPGFEKRRQES